MIAMGQLFTSDQITQNLTTIGHRMAFENEQNRYRIVKYKRHRRDKCKQFKRETYGLIYLMHKGCCM